MFKSTLPAAVRQGALNAKLPKGELKLLDQIATMVDIDESQEIISQATVGRECFVVVDGEFTVVGPGFEASIGGGDVAGELALLTGKTRSASVTAATDATVYAMHPREFATLLSQAPTFRGQVKAAAEARLGTGETVSLPAQFVSA